MLEALFPAFRSTAPRVRHPWHIALAGGVLALATACGSQAAADPSTAANVSSSPAASTGASQAAYTACLREHGATVPTAVPTAKPTAAKAGGHPGGNAIPAAARAACASLRPQGVNRKNTAVEAFDACMSAHGEAIPAAKQPDPAASPAATGTARFLHGLNPDNAQVAAALKACQPKLPATANG